MDEHSTKGYLMSRMTVGTKLITSLPSIRKKLASYPHLAMVGDGSSLRYVIETEGDSRFYVLSIAEDRFVLEIYSKSSPAYFLHEALLRMISFMALLSEDYEFDMRSMFPYLAEGLACNIPKPKVQSLNMDLKGSDSDILLASRINSLNRRNAQLGAALELARSKFLRVAALLLVNRYGSSLDEAEITKDSSIGKEDLESVLEAMQGLGYKAMPLGRGKYSLVRT